MPVVINPYALTTLATAKEHLGIPVLNVTFDDLVARMINSATGKIETFCDRKFKQRIGITEYLDGFANNRILLDQWPATKPSELWIDSSGEFTDVTKQLPTTDYQLDYSARGEGIGLVLCGSRRLFPRGTRNIKVVYDGGFVDIPAELEDACLWTIDFLYQMRSDRSVATETKGKNQENTTFRDDLPRFVKDTLYAYKRSEWPTGDRAVFTV